MSEMREELARLVSYVFQTQGKRRIGEEEWTRLLSLERRWFAPTQARTLLAVARTEGLLHNAGQADLEVGLEAEALPLPIDYRPDAKLAERAATGSRLAAAPSTASLFRRIVGSLSKQLGQAEGEIVGRVNATQQAFGGLVRAEVAALYYGALNGIRVDEFFDEVEQTLRA